mmetsp:Transcript_31200/g.104979  ORF Transcript_31200/g.104979 Transcript_31200/m.104979 type:complete len:324 (+) Transcript_31200:1179-2150(+)
MLHPQGAAPDRVRLVLAFLAADAQRVNVDEPHGRRQLRVAVVLRPERAAVVRPHLVDAAFELHGLCKLVKVRLALERGHGREHDVLIRTHHILVPRSQPRHRVVVLHAAPAPPGLQTPRRDVRGPDVDGHLLRLAPLLQSARLGVLAAAAEERRWLHPKVAHLFQMTVHDRVARLQLLVVLDLAHGLALSVGSGFLNVALQVNVLTNPGKVALGHALHHMALAQSFLKVVEEVLLEGFSLAAADHELRAVLGHRGIESGHLLLGRRQIHLVAVVEHLHAVRFVGRRKDHAVVLQRVPRHALRRLRRLPPRKGLDGLFHALDAR